MNVTHDLIKSQCTVLYTQLGSDLFLNDVALMPPTHRNLWGRLLRKQCWEKRANVCVLSPVLWGGLHMRKGKWLWPGAWITVKKAYLWGSLKLNNDLSFEKAALGMGPCVERAPDHLRHADGSAVVLFVTHLCCKSQLGATQLDALVIQSQF